MSKFIDIIGQRFGRLVVVKFSHMLKNESVWECRCDCGNVVNIRRTTLGRCTFSCGCLRKDVARKRGVANKGRGLPIGISARNKLFDHYKRAAVDRNLEFKLTMEQFQFLTKQNCYYCGIEPAQKTGDWKPKGEYVYNGIDRKNNNVGYVIENCVSCCKTCNNAKHTMSEQEFCGWISRVYMYKLQGLSV